MKSDSKKTFEFKAQEDFYQGKNNSNALEISETVSTLGMVENPEAIEFVTECDSATIPIVKMPLGNINGVISYPNDFFWEHSAVPLKTPIIVEQNGNVIAGTLQYFTAEESGQEEIDAIYIESLKNKDVSIANLKKQFSDQSVCYGIAYSIYACVSDYKESITFEDFCYFAEYLFDNINECIDRYINAIDESAGE